MFSIGYTNQLFEVNATLKFRKSDRCSKDLMCNLGDLTAYVVRRRYKGVTRYHSCIERDGINIKISGNFADQQPALVWAFLALLHVDMMGVWERSGYVKGE